MPTSLIPLPLPYPRSTLMIGCTAAWSTFVNPVLIPNWCSWVEEGQSIRHEGLPRSTHSPIGRRMGHLYAYNVQIEPGNKRRLYAKWYAKLLNPCSYFLPSAGHLNFIHLLENGVMRARFALLYTDEQILARNSYVLCGLLRAVTIFRYIPRGDRMQS